MLVAPCQVGHPARHGARSRGCRPSLGPIQRKSRLSQRPSHPFFRDFCGCVNTLPNYSCSHGLNPNTLWRSPLNRVAIARARGRRRPSKLRRTERLNRGEQWQKRSRKTMNRAKTWGRHWSKCGRNAADKGKNGVSWPAGQRRMGRHQTISTSRPSLVLVLVLVLVYWR